MESFRSMVNTVSMGLAMLAGEVGLIEGMVTLVKTGRWKPLLNFLVEEMEGYESKSIPQQYVALAKASGPDTWDTMVKLYDIEPIPTDERRQQDPVYGTREQQYRFRKGSGERFARYNLLLMVAGMDRHTRDWVSGEMAAGRLGDEADYKRYGLPTAWTYLGNWETSLKSHDIRTVQRKNLMFTDKELKDLSK
jgi:hypothetical protein